MADNAKKTPKASRVSRHFKRVLNRRDGTGIVSFVKLTLDSNFLE